MELTFPTQSKLRLYIIVNSLPKGLDDFEDVENKEAVREQMIEFIKQGKFNLPIYLNYSYDEQTGAITMKAADDGLNEALDAMEKDIFPIIIAKRSQEMSKLELNLAAKGMRMMLEERFKKGLNEAVNTIESAIYKKDEAKIYITSHHPKTKEIETTILEEK